MPAATREAHFRHLVDIVRNNLEHQQDWIDLQVHGDPDKDGHTGTAAGAAGGEKPGAESEARLAEGKAGANSAKNHPRLLISGLPPRRMYIHPDEQIEILRAERALGSGQRIPQPPEYEWVLPLHLAEKPTLSQFAAVFDSLDVLPRPQDASIDKKALGDEAQKWLQWRGPKRGKRILLAVVQDDSTVVYYFMHDGIVKPRQN